MVGAAGRTFIVALSLGAVTACPAPVDAQLAPPAPVVVGQTVSTSPGRLDGLVTDHRGAPLTGEPLAGRKLERTEALLMAARVRLRPILMTTLAMIFGMVPLAFAISEGSEQRAPMGQAVIGGVITSSLLTLVVVPVVYCSLDDLSNWLRRKWRGM